MTAKRAVGIIRVIVCGGRHFADAAMLSSTLNHLHSLYPFRVVITGGTRGADRLAEAWARSHGVECIAEPVTQEEWDTLGRAAGPIRNQRMIDDHRPSHCVAFPGGSGTRDMIRRARKAGIVVLECFFPPGRTVRAQIDATSPTGPQAND